MSGTEEVLLFELGAALYAARAAGVSRIGNPREQELGLLVADSCLGRARAPARSLIVVSEDGLEAGLCVDRVLGFRTVAAADVLPLPALAARALSTSAVAGLLLLDGSPTPLVDVSTLIREQHPVAAPKEREGDE